jgi:ectoine hydroxylase-related dioxygenase (phytanoyl-CoA dioxygenase family)
MTSLEQNGFAVIPGAFCQERIRALINAIENHRSGVGGSDSAGLRNVAEAVNAVRSLRGDKMLVDTASGVLGRPAFCVRTLFFDKTPGANWKVAWHQDLTICVKERRDADGFGPWSVKEGVTHVQPPAEILEKMITLRLHLDDCAADNGALRVLPGTHCLGRLDQHAIQKLRGDIAEVICEVPAGGILLMRPLLLHASAPATAPRHRRVLHFEFAAAALPGGLEWYG